LRYQLELGELAVELLRLRKEKFKKEGLETEYQEAEAEYQEAREGQEAVKEQVMPPVLSEKEELEMRELYRRGVRKCHPDVVGEGFREMATKVFVELREAYEMNDIQRVRELTVQIETGNWEGDEEIDSRLRGNDGGGSGNDGRGRGDDGGGGQE